LLARPSSRLTSRGEAAESAALGEWRLDCTKRPESTAYSQDRALARLATSVDE
jgi:hypothetical protein